MRLKAVLTLFILSLLTIAVLPEEVRLGSSYKLVYFHVPVSVVTIVSILLFPAIHLRFPEIVKEASLTTTVYALVHLLLSAIFMFAAWGGIIFSEPKFVFSVVLLFFALVHASLCFIDVSLAKYYSFLAFAVVPYFYLQTISASFQLHPKGVEMPTFLYLPYVFTFPLVVILYLELARILSSKSKSI